MLKVTLLRIKIIFLLKHLTKLECENYSNKTNEKKAIYEHLHIMSIN